MRTNGFRRGDTIVEVIFAVALFSMVAVGAITLMNKGVRIAQQSLEVTLVRQQIDSQAEMLRYIHQSAGRGDAAQANLWGKLVKKTTTNVVEVVGSNENQCLAIETGFFLYPKNNAIGIGDTKQLKQPETYARIIGENSYGVSIQLVRGARHYDAYVQACWYGADGALPTTRGTIVRLYDANA